MLMDTYAILNEIELHLLCKVAHESEGSVCHGIHLEHKHGGKEGAEIRCTVPGLPNGG